MPSGRKASLPPEPSREGGVAGPRGSDFPEGGLGGRALQGRAAGPRRARGPSRVRPADGRGPAVRTGKAGGEPGGEAQAGGQPAGRVRASLLCPAGCPRPLLPRGAVVWLKLSLRVSRWFGCSFVLPLRSSARRASSLLSSSVPEGAESLRLPHPLCRDGSGSWLNAWSLKTARISVLFPGVPGGTVDARQNRVCL